MKGEGSERTAVARLLGAIAHDLFDGPVELPGPVRIGYELEPAGPPDDEFLKTRLSGCPPSLVTAATHRASWTDSTGVTNVAHTGALGPVVPIVARETTLAIWRMLAADPRLSERGEALAGDESRLLETVTTDKTPGEILRTGVDAASRVLVQHAYLAARTPYDDPAAFAAVLRDSGIFSTVAGTWHWGLQASTYRRGLIPVQLICFGGRVTYSADTVAALRAMKDHRIATAHDDIDPSAAQYVALRRGEQPRCLAHPPLPTGDRRTSLVARVADLYVDTFVTLLGTVATEAQQRRSATVDGSFEVPDMTCQHCIRTITKAVAAFGVEPPVFDLETKRVTANFPSAAVRDQSFAAIRGRGYTVVPPAGSCG